MKIMTTKEFERIESYNILGDNEFNYPMMNDDCVYYWDVCSMCFGTDEDIISVDVYHNVANSYLVTMYTTIMMEMKW